MLLYVYSCRSINIYIYVNCLHIEKWEKMKKIVAISTRSYLLVSVLLTRPISLYCCTFKVVIQTSTFTKYSSMSDSEIAAIS